MTDIVLCVICQKEIKYKVRTKAVVCRGKTINGVYIRSDCFRKRKSRMNVKRYVLKQTKDNRKPQREIIATAKQIRELLNKHNSFKDRTCLSCGNSFFSHGAYNRRCEKCTTYERKLVVLY